MTNLAFSKTDVQFMSLALSEAEQAAAVGDYPVGAALVLNGELLDSGRNSLFTDNRWTAHAEHNVIAKNSAILRDAFRDSKPYNVCLYTTLEPCLMCLGITKLHRVNRIVFACPDPHGGTSNINPDDLGGITNQAGQNLRAGYSGPNLVTSSLSF